MQELIKIKETKKGKQIVSARELHEKLEVRTPFNKWAVRKITTNPFFQNREDYVRLDNFVRAGQNAMEFALTLDTAKKIAMSENTSIGNDVKDYFLMCEKKLQNTLPQTFSEALQLAADQARQLELQAPKVEFAETILQSETSISIGNMAKIIGWGQNKLFLKLREDKVLIPSGKNKNVPYQRYLDAGYFEVTEMAWKNSKGSGITFITKVTPKGQEYLSRRYKK